jgi:hypothetical protein
MGSVPRSRRERADARIRTADPFITNEVLYQLSYAGEPEMILGGIGRSFLAAPFPSRLT